MKKSNTVLVVLWFIACFIIGTLIKAYHRSVKVEAPFEIYTVTDIYYLYNDSLTSESGNIYIVSKNRNLMKQKISELTSNDVNNILNN